jgi:hypothetical protein
MPSLAEISDQLHEASDALTAAERAVIVFVNGHPDLRTALPILPFGAMERREQIAQDRAEYQRLESKRRRLAEQRAEILAAYAKAKMEQVTQRHSVACPTCTEEAHHV